MPISQRLSRRLYNRILDLVGSASDFIFFGTYSLSIESGIISQITAQKQKNPNLLIACLIPPPTDFILWDFSVRGHLLRAYGLTGATQVDLARAVAEDPQPAYAILDGLWNQSRAGASRRGVISHITRIGELYSRNIVVFLEPNMHAKFVASESDIYEGSGNLTKYGLTVNVEVYNFYPRKYERIYNYASRSYVDFLRTYLTNFVNWKSGSRYLTNANQLGTRVEQVANTFGIRFNPKITREKINILTKARDQMTAVRSELWQLKGHKYLLNLDFSLGLVQSQIQSTLSKLWGWLEREIESDFLNDIEKSLENATHATKQVANALMELKTDERYLSSYESQYLEKNLIEAERFQHYLREHMEKERE